MNPEKGAKFVTQLMNNENGLLVDIECVVNIITSQNMIRQATSFLLDMLEENKPEQAGPPKEEDVKPLLHTINMLMPLLNTLCGLVLPLLPPDSQTSSPLKFSNQVIHLHQTPSHPPLSLGVEMND